MRYAKTSTFFLAFAVFVVCANAVAQIAQPPVSRQEVASIKRDGPQHLRDLGSTSNVPPTQLYKIAAGDTLQITLLNAPNASDYYTVRADGSIDFPLAGTDPQVAGMTAKEIEHQLSSRIAIYQNARIEVIVRDFGSHKISVSGLVERGGERSLPREAMPLYTVKADVGVMLTATTVVITRSSGQVEGYDLREARTDDVLVSPGDLIEFAR